MRILIVRLGRAGDMVMTTPAIKALIECHPKASFTLLTSPDGNRLLRGFSPAIKDVWIWNRSALDAFLQKIQLKKRLKNSHFDKIVCFETRQSIIDLFANMSTERFWRTEYNELKHSARHYLDLAEKACSKKLEDIPVSLPVSTEASQQVDNELESAGILKDDVLVAFHPTYSGFSNFNLRKREARKHKLWPAENFGELARKLQDTVLENGNSPKLIMDLLDDEVSLGREIVEYSNNSITLLNVKPDFERYKALLQRVDLLVSPDTGPMHIAAAVGTRIVALFSGKDPADCGPYMDDSYFTIIRAEDTPNPDAGISAIKVETVLDACKDQLNRISLAASD